MYSQLQLWPCICPWLHSSRPVHPIIPFPRFQSGIYVAFPACMLAFSTVSFHRHRLAVCCNFLSVWKLCVLTLVVYLFTRVLVAHVQSEWVSVCKRAVNGLSLVICESCLKCRMCKPLSGVFNWITFEGSVWRPYQLQQWPEFIAK